MTVAVAHSYMSASENLAQYRADQCGRQAITVAELHAEDRLCEATIYVFDEDAAEFGLDPWKTVGLDKYVEGRAPDPAKPFIMSNASGTRDWAVSGDLHVYVSKRDLITAGVKIPESKMEQFSKRESGI